MSAALKNRLARIEAAVVPKAASAWIRLIDPGAAATIDEREQFNRERQAARETGANVIIRRIV